MRKASEALSPWGMSPAKSVEIFPLECSFDKEIAIPGSKSFTNRALILAAMASGISKLYSPLFSDDSYWCLNALKKLGINSTADREKNCITIQGIGDNRLKMMDVANPPYIGSAGTIARFLPGAIAAKGEGEIILSSSSQLARRPVSEMVEALRLLGAEITSAKDSAFPMTIKGGSLEGGKTRISGATSSQFVSGLLIAAPMARKPVTISITDHIVQIDYVRITLDLMKTFGIDVQYDKDLREFYVDPKNYQAVDMHLEADASTSTYFFALAAATKSKITITNLNPKTLQPDFGFVKHMETLGCDVKTEGTRITVSGPDHLEGNKTFNFNDCSDSTPALISLAPFVDGELKVEGVAHIRKHESDRLSVMHDTLRDANVPVVEFEDGLLVTPKDGAPTHVVVNPHDDHRMAMGFSIMAAAGKGATITDPSCVSKTCPNFFEILESVGVKVQINS